MALPYPTDEVVGAMTVSSRTPEGSPFRCLVCGYEGRIDPSKPDLDAPCPSCGSLLWIGSDRPNVKSRLAWIRPLCSSLAIFVIVVIGAATFGGLGPTEWIILDVLAVLLFGRSLPELGRWLGG